MENLTRDKDYINSLVYKDGDVYKCKKRVSIEYPSWYNEKGMGSIQEEVNFYGIFIIIVDDKYSVSLVPTICRAKPIVIKEVDRDGVKYTRLEFAKDDPFIQVSVVKETLLSYNYYNNFFIRSNIPWFITYDDLNRIQTNSLQYSGSNIGANPMMNELTTAYVTRSKSNPDLFYRQCKPNEQYGYVDLMNPFYSLKTTIGKITGSYLQDGIVSALVKKTDNKITDMEKHLKG